VKGRVIKEVSPDRDSLRQDWNEWERVKEQHGKKGQIFHNENVPTILLFTKGWTSRKDSISYANRKTMNFEISVGWKVSLMKKNNIAN